jgi:hypothetical protein
MYNSIFFEKKFLKVRFPINRFCLIRNLLNKKLQI